MVIFVDHYSDVFAFFVLCGDVDIFLFPVDMDLEFDLVIDLGFEDEVIEPAA